MPGRKVRGDRLQRMVKRANSLYLKNVPDVDANHTVLSLQQQTADRLGSKVSNLIFEVSQVHGQVLQSNNTGICQPLHITLFCTLLHNAKLQRIFILNSHILQIFKKTHCTVYCQRKTSLRYLLLNSITGDSG